MIASFLYLCSLNSLYTSNTFYLRILMFISAKIKTSCALEILFTLCWIPHYICFMGNKLTRKLSSFFSLQFFLIPCHCHREWLNSSIIFFTSPKNPRVIDRSASLVIKLCFPVQIQKLVSGIQPITIAKFPKISSLWAPHISLQITLTLYSKALHPLVSSDFCILITFSLLNVMHSNINAFSYTTSHILTFWMTLPFLFSISNCEQSLKF